MRTCSALVAAERLHTQQLIAHEANARASCEEGVHEENKARPFLGPKTVRESGSGLSDEDVRPPYEADLFVQAQILQHDNDEILTPILSPPTLQRINLKTKARNDPTTIPNLILPNVATFRLYGHIAAMWPSAPFVFLWRNAT